MKLVRFGAPGCERPGVLVNESSIVDVSGWFADFDTQFFRLNGIAALKNAKLEDLPSTNVENTRLGSPIAKPYQILCVGLNYAPHILELGMPLPDEPTIFNKSPHALSGPCDDVVIPVNAVAVDWEVELAVVIGKRARYLSSPAEAGAHVAGYAIANDVSERSFQFDRGGQWVVGKSSETFCPLGPWLVTPDEVGDPQNLDLHLRVNGNVMQNANTSEMVFGVFDLIWYLSQFLALEPGDLVCTGTPGGVGMGHTPPRYLAAGDVMELTVANLGAQRQRVKISPDSRNA